MLLCPGVPGFPWPEEPEEPDELDAEYERALDAGDVDALAGLLQRVWAAAGPTQAVMEQLRSAARAEISSGNMEQQDPPVFDRLGEISVPTSLLVGDADYPPLIEANRQAAARIGGCELTVVPGMDHLPPLREPDLVLRTITSTLSSPGKRGPAGKAGAGSLRLGEADVDLQSGLTVPRPGGSRAGRPRARRAGR